MWAYRSLRDDVDDVDDVAFGRAGLIDHARRAVKIGLGLRLGLEDAVCTRHQRAAFLDWLSASTKRLRKYNRITWELLESSVALEETQSSLGSKAQSFIFFTIVPSEIRSAVGYETYNYVRDNNFDVIYTYAKCFPGLAAICNLTVLKKKNLFFLNVLFDLFKYFGTKTKHSAAPSPSNDKP